MHGAAIAALLALVATYGWFLSGWPRRWPRHRYARWLLRAPLAFGLSSLAALGWVDQLAAIPIPPPAFDSARAFVHHHGLGEGVALELAALAGLALGCATGLAMAAHRVRRGRHVRTLGDHTAVLPRTNRELFPAAAISVTAGIVEELYFRLALPLVAILAGIPTLPAFLLAALMFAGAHRYQRWQGMAATFAAGIVQTVLYLATGDLWFAMLVHALINLNALFLRPLLIDRLARDSL